jgi:hypothetical protein
MIFVDPSGDDSGPGTADRPFATLERARDAAAPGSVVELGAGTYRLTRTFELTAAHSGVTYRARGHGTPEQAEVVISGGRPVTGWITDGDGTAHAPHPGPTPRQLYVGGRRVERAAIALADLGLRRTADGYTADGTAPQAWRGEVEFVYRGVYPWTEGRCPVAAVTGDARTSAIAMARPGFDHIVGLYHSVITWDGPGAGETYGADSPTFAENSPAFVTEGTFAAGGGTVTYRPRPGDDLGDAVAPALETLAHARGVRDVVFQGITFADAAWNGPSGPDGFPHYHGNGYYDGGGDLRIVEFAEGQGRVTVPGSSASIPGNVVVEDSHGVLLEDCRLTRMGGVALEFRGAGSGNTVRRTEVTGTAGGGVVVGAGARGHRVEDCRVHRVGRDYRGSPAVLVAGTEDTVLARNLVADTPHAGIVVYEGRGTRVLHNLVHDTMGVLADGGGVYVSGPQGTSRADGAVIRGNVVRDTLTSYNFGLYTDYGAAWVAVEGNAVYRADAPVALAVSPPLEHVVFTGNVWDADPGPAPEGVVLDGNTVLAPEAFATDQRVAAITAAAGPRRAAEDTAPEDDGSRHAG